MDRFPIQLHKLSTQEFYYVLEDNSQDSPIYDSIHDMDDVYLQNADDKRIVIDYIAGMTDDFFYNQYQKLFVPQSYGYQLQSS